MIFIMVLLGGLTRLTESGLSITEWQPISGVIPPLNEAQWNAEFEHYKAIPQYAAIHAEMSLAEFKTIFFWEFIHRLWGRTIGLVFVLPFLYLLWKRRISRHLAPKLGSLAVLLGLQGALGWYMVESGLQDRIEVSQYRLTAHLGTAVILYLALLWIALDLLQAARPPSAGHPRLRRALTALMALAFLTLLAGGFVAGLRAGYIYNTFPLMNGYVIPPDYVSVSPWYLNPFENLAAAQFDHRLLAELTWLCVMGLWLWSLRLDLSPGQRAALHGLAGAATLQVALGIATLLLVVPVPLAAAHQAGALVLLSAAILARHEFRRPVSAAANPRLDDPGDDAIVRP